MKLVTGSQVHVCNRTHPYLAAERASSSLAERNCSASCFLARFNQSCLYIPCMYVTRRTIVLALPQRTFVLLALSLLLRLSTRKALLLFTWPRQLAFSLQPHSPPSSSFLLRLVTRSVFAGASRGTSRFHSSAWRGYRGPWELSIRRTVAWFDVVHTARLMMRERPRWTRKCGFPLFLLFIYFFFFSFSFVLLFPSPRIVSRLTRRTSTPRKEADSTRDLREKLWPVSSVSTEAKKSSSGYLRAPCSIGHGQIPLVLVRILRLFFGGC